MLIYFQVLLRALYGFCSFLNDSNRKQLLFIVDEGERMLSKSLNKSRVFFDAIRFDIM